METVADVVPAGTVLPTAVGDPPLAERSVTDCVATVEVAGVHVSVAVEPPAELLQCVETVTPVGADSVAAPKLVLAVVPDVKAAAAGWAKATTVATTTTTARSQRR